ncbi:MAG TPA: hypothetical protein VHA52_10010 [Candidatus Babeliaceae bacterium]|nr:hypothetical protein [Candidatus Babeliaceae bacterium]
MEEEFLVNNEDLETQSQELTPQHQEFSNAEVIEEPEQEVVPEKKVKSKERQRLSHLAKYTRGLEEKLQALAQEKEQWRDLYERTSEAAAYHNEEAVKLKIEELQKAKQEAYHEDKMDRYWELEKEIPPLYSKLDKVKSWKEEQERRRVQEAEAREAYTQQAMQLNQQREQNLDAWLRSNGDWYSPRSRDYDNNLANEVTNFAQALESELNSRGQAHYIGMPEYYQEINNFVNYSRNKSAPQQNTRHSSSNSSYAGTVGNVRNGANGKEASRTYRPTKEDREWMDSLKALGIGAEDYYLNSKAEVERNVREGKYNDGYNERYRR